MGLVENAPHGDVTYKIIGLAMAVYNDLGPGHREVVYHRAL
jgi:GxxExxY protein